MELTVKRSSLRKVSRLSKYGGLQLISETLGIRKMEKVKVINSIFSTADAEDVSIEFDSYDLVLRFTDWQGLNHVIKFSDTEFMRWDDDVNYKKFRGDCPHEIIDSELIKTKNLDSNVFHHYMLCFNAASNLEIISAKMQLLEPSGT